MVDYYGVYEQHREIGRDYYSGNPNATGHIEIKLKREVGRCSVKGHFGKLRRCPNKIKYTFCQVIGGNSSEEVWKGWHIHDVATHTVFDEEGNVIKTWQKIDVNDGNKRGKCEVKK